MTQQVCLELCDCDPDGHLGRSSEAELREYPVTISAARPAPPRAVLTGLRSCSSTYLPEVKQREDEGDAEARPLKGAGRVLLVKDGRVHLLAEGKPLE